MGVCEGIYICALISVWSLYMYMSLLLYITRGNIISGDVVFLLCCYVCVGIFVFVLIYLIFYLNYLKLILSYWFNLFLNNRKDIPRRSIAVFLCILLVGICFCWIINVINYLWKDSTMFKLSMNEVNISFTLEEMIDLIDCLDLLGGL